MRRTSVEGYRVTGFHYRFFHTLLSYLRAGLWGCPLRYVGVFQLCKGSIAIIHRNMLQLRIHLN